MKNTFPPQRTEKIIIMILAIGMISCSPYRALPCPKNQQFEKKPTYQQMTGTIQNQAYLEKTPQ